MLQHVQNLNPGQDTHKISMVWCTHTAVCKGHPDPQTETQTQQPAEKARPRRTPGTNGGRQHRSRTHPFLRSTESTSMHWMDRRSVGRHRTFRSTLSHMAPTHGAAEHTRKDTLMPAAALAAAAAALLRFGRRDEAHDCWRGDQDRHWWWIHVRLSEDHELASRPEDVARRIGIIAIYVSLRRPQYPVSLERDGLHRTQAVVADEGTPGRLSR